MNWETIGAVGEVAGAIGVVVTLIYLSVQIRQNTRALDQSRIVNLSQSYQHRSETRRQAHFAIADSEVMAKVQLKVEEGGWPRDMGAIDQLEPLEKLRFKEMMAASLVRLDDACYQYREGFLDEQAWSMSQKRIRVLGPTWIKFGLVSSASMRLQEELKDLNLARE